MKKIGNHDKINTNIVTQEGVIKKHGTLVKTGKNKWGLLIRIRDIGC